MPDRHAEEARVPRHSHPGRFRGEHAHASNFTATLAGFSPEQVVRTLMDFSRMKDSHWRHGTARFDFKLRQNDGRFLKPGALNNWNTCGETCPRDGQCALQTFEPDKDLE